MTALNTGPTTEDSHSELDEEAYAMAVAELPRPTSSLKLEQAAWHVRSQAKHRALRKAAPLPPPHGSGGPFYELPRDVLVQVLSASIGSHVAELIQHQKVRIDYYLRALEDCKSRFLQNGWSNIYF